MKRALAMAALAAAILGVGRGWSAEIQAVNQWGKVDEGRTGTRIGSVLLYAADLKQMLLVGPAEGAAFVQAFDPQARTWSIFAAVAPRTKDPIHPYYQAAYDPAGSTLYCLSGGPVLYSYHAGDKA